MMARMAVYVIKAIACEERLRQGKVVRMTGFAELETLAEMNREIQGATNLRSLLRVLVEKAVIGVNFERGLIYLVEGDYLRCVAFLDRVDKKSAQLLKKRVGFRLEEDSLETHAVRLAKPVHTSDTLNDPRIGARYRQHLNSREYCVVPLMGRRGVLGVFTGDKHYSGESITEADIKTLELFAGQVGLAIENAQLHEEAKSLSSLLEKRVEERTSELNRANALLTKKARELDTLFSLANLLNRALLTPEIIAQVLGLLQGLGHRYAAIHSAGRDFELMGATRELLPGYPEALGPEGLLRLRYEGVGSAGATEVALERVADGGAAEWFVARGIATCVRVPIPGDSGEAATLFIFRDEKVDGGGEGLEFLSAFAKQAGVALERAKAVERIRRERDDAESASLLLERENTWMKDKLGSGFSVASIIGADGGLRPVMDVIARVAPTNATVALFGETGTGKELLAKAIHALSGRAKKTLVAVNCAAIPEELLESELFGYERGAFTGAHRQKQGLFEVADGSTIFLDEIGEISARTQTKLLRVLQEREVMRVGGRHPIRIDARVIVATNRKQNDPAFRADFIHRVSVFPIEVPPLRERRGDIPKLIGYFLSKHARHPAQMPVLDAEEVRALCSYDWPGNVRELENVIERMTILGHAKGDSLARLTKLPGDVNDDAPMERLADALATYKRHYVAQALSRFGGNKAKTAAALGMPRSNFSRLTKALGL